jgi:hypothetical protein
MMLQLSDFVVFRTSSVHLLSIINIMDSIKYVLLGRLAGVTAVYHCGGGRRVVMVTRCCLNVFDVVDRYDFVPNRPPCHLV